jgi:hypothetical protein
MWQTSVLAPDLAAELGAGTMKRIYTMPPR